MTGRQYADLIAAYLVHNFGTRGIEVYREVPLGKTIIGKDRKLDILVLHRQTGRALAVECKYQDSQGTTDEKIPYALGDLEALRIAACLVYAGEGFSPGIRHMMAASHLAAECLPPLGLSPCDATRELDHILAMTFEWWDLVVRGRAPVTLGTLARSGCGIAVPAAAGLAVPVETPRVESPPAPVAALRIEAPPAAGLELRLGPVRSKED